MTGPRMRRTTIAIDDDLLRDLKRRAAKDGVSLSALVNRLLRAGLRERAAFRLHLTTVKGDGLRPGVDLDDKDALFDLMDGDVRTTRSSPDSPVRGTAARRR